MPLALLIVAWMVGLLLSAVQDVPPLPLLLTALSLALLAIASRLLRWKMLPGLLLALLLLGFWRGEWAESHRQDLLFLEGQPVALRGWVSSDPESARQRAEFVLTVTDVGQDNDWQPVRGKALVYAFPPDDMVAVRGAPYFRYGDMLEVRGDLAAPQPFQGFDYPAFLANQGISSIMRPSQVHWISQGRGHPILAAVFDLRRRMAESLATALPSPESALAQALLLGVTSEMPDQAAEDFRRTGTAHLLAISGLQVAMLLGLALAASAWLMGKRCQLYLLPPLALVWGYAAISGLEIPVVRAAIMGTFYLAALALGRPRSVLPALALGAAVMTVVNPLAARQVSFQLSFAAVAGIALAGPWQARFAQAFLEPADQGAAWPRRWAMRCLLLAGTAVVVSLAATLATFPIVAASFHQVPLWGIPATILSLPVRAAILIGSAVTALAGLLHPVLGQALGWAAWPPLAYQLAVAAVTPGHAVTGSWVGPLLMAAWFGLLGGTLLWPGGLGRMWRWLGQGGPPAGSLAAASVSWRVMAAAGFVLAALALLVWARVWFAPDGRLHVYFFDVGQGDSILVITPQGRQVLVDGGPDAQSAVTALGGPLLPWDRSLDLVVLTHLDADHSLGLLEVLARYDVGLVLAGTPDPESPMYPRWDAALVQESLQPQQVAAGYRILLDSGVALEVLNPPNPPWQGTQADRNNNGVALRLTYADFSILLAADIEAEAEAALVRSFPQALDSDVLKVAHHGSRSSTTPDFLQKVSPALAVVSVGKDNRYGHPHPEVLARLDAYLGKDRVYRTDQQGVIEVISDGKGLWVKTHRRR
ncbi:MAG: DUF4131 domain-containing protein [SAR202 cluster bacterium]|nr:DUF4131 domain-containing protein [SAR202 cluster bacterium]